MRHSEYVGYKAMQDKAIWHEYKLRGFGISCTLKDMYWNLWIAFAACSCRTEQQGTKVARHAKVGTKHLLQTPARTAQMLGGGQAVMSSRSRNQGCSVIPLHHITSCVRRLMTWPGPCFIRCARHCPVWLCCMSSLRLQGIHLQNLAESFTAWARMCIRLPCVRRLRMAKAHLYGLDLK